MVCVLFASWLYTCTRSSLAQDAPHEPPPATSPHEEEPIDSLPAGPPPTDEEPFVKAQYDPLGRYSLILLDKPHDWPHGAHPVTHAS